MKNLQKHNCKSPSVYFSKNGKSAVAGDKCHNWMKIHEKMIKFQLNSQQKT